jgi:hypothetical protein
MTYTVGKISIKKGEDIVQGTSTLFVDVANIKIGDLFYFRTNDQDTLLTVIDVIDNSSLRVSHLNGSSFTPSKNYNQIAYGIIQDFGQGLTAKLSSQLSLLQRKWHQRENELTGWFSSNKASHNITSFNGEMAQIPTPAGIKELAKTAQKTSEYLTQFEQDIQRNAASLAQVAPKLDEFDSQTERMEFMHKDVHQRHNDVVNKHNEFKVASHRIGEQADQVHTLSAQVADNTWHADIARKTADAQASVSALMTSEVADAKQQIDTQLAHSVDVAKSVEVHSTKAQTAQAFAQALADKMTTQYNEVGQLKDLFSANTLKTNIAKKAVDAQAAASSMQAFNSERAAEEANQFRQHTELLKDQTGQIKAQASVASQQAQTAASNANEAKSSATYQAEIATQASVLAHEQADKAQYAANLATKVTSDFAAATTPEAGKVPVALHDAQIDEQWVNFEQGMSRLALGILSNNLSRYQKDHLINSLSLQIDDLRNKLDVTQVELEEVAKKPVAEINKDDFRGTHAPGESHGLPVLNMVERGWLSTASYQEGMAEFLRMNGGSGVVGTRQYQADKGFSVGHRVVDASYATLNIHNHPNYKAMPGMAEVAACINGYYFRTRHNDYRLMHSVPGPYLARTHSIAAQIPSYVNALPTGCEADGRINFQNTQAGYMRDVKQQSPQDCIWELSYLECWIETFQDDLNDPTDSFRHSNDGKKLKQIFDKGRYLNYSGHKNRSENLPYHPMRISYVDDQGVPQHGLLQFRISSMAVATLEQKLGLSNAKIIVGNTGSHYHHIAEPLSQAQIEQLKTGAVPALTVKTSTDFNHHHDIRITWKNGQLIGEDLDTSHQHPVSVIYGDSSQLPYNEDKALKGIIDHTNRFKLVKDLRSRARVGNNQKLIRSRMARFECVDLAQLCEQLPGLNGVGASLKETYDQYGLNDTLQDWLGGELNAAYYNRRYRFNRNDASGRVTANRGFNDPTLFCAKTTHSKVVGGFSWMIPLELILRTPREYWNPYECAYVPNTQLRAEEKNHGGKNAETAFSGIDDRHFYFGTPKALLSEQITGNDPADTTNTAWVKDKNGTPRLLYGNGIRVHDYDGHRQRFPVYPLYFEHSHDANQQHWLRDNLKTLLKQAVSGTLTINDIDEML